MHRMTAARFVNPVQGGVREDRVEWGIEAKLASIRQSEFQFWKVLPGLRNHRYRRIEAHNLGTPVGDLRGQMAGSAAEIENPFTGLRMEDIDEIRALFPDERMPVVIERAVPSVRRQFPPPGTKTK